MGRRDAPFPDLGIQTSKSLTVSFLSAFSPFLLIAALRAQSLKAAVSPCLVLSSPFP